MTGNATPKYEKDVQGGRDIDGRWRDKDGKYRPPEVVLGLVKQPKFCAYCGMPLPDIRRFSA